MDVAFLVLNLLVLAVTLESDVGTRKVRWFRVLRPAVTALVAIPFFLTGIDLSGIGLLLEVGALFLGVAMGYAACRLMRFLIDPGDAQPRTRAGWAYVLAWTGVIAVKTLMTYAATTWFPAELGRFMLGHHLGPDSIRAAFIFLALGSPLVRPAYLWIGGRRFARRHGTRLRLFTRPQQVVRFPAHR
ncbi:hypothetical protein [Amycolatopsis taiwanensis]|uniref:DUF1453 domain-containing protein n=1 Tax=Amycolatopsis taiwanensis TaxID=342230 RepID=A0A9W6R412_9PSEU|nr:hypothetical protein [Amycolatopsis taiwanensis]GLY67247.1 hypothetical protein Atai01_38660 [Amycolatopsis taiwanensis]